MTATELEQAIQAESDKLQKVQKVHDGGQRRLAALRTERQSHVLPARVHQDAEAQKHLRRLDAEIDAAQKDARADGEAIAHISGTIKTLGAEMAKVKQQDHRQRVRALIEIRANGEGERRVLQMAEQLKRAVDDLQASDEEIKAALRQLDPQLDDQARRLNSMHDMLWNFVAYNLEPIGGRHLGNLFHSMAGPIGAPTSPNVSREC